MNSTSVEVGSLRSSSAPPDTDFDLPAFQESDYYERLLALRSEEPKTFLLRTSQSTRAALSYYERAKAHAQSGEAKPTQNVLS